MPSLSLPCIWPRANQENHGQFTEIPKLAWTCKSQPQERSQLLSCQISITTTAFMPNLYNHYDHCLHQECGRNGPKPSHHQRTAPQKTLVHANPFTEKQSYTQTFLHRDLFTQRYLYTPTNVHTYTSSIYQPKKMSYTWTLLHTNLSRHNFSHTD